MAVVSLAEAKDQCRIRHDSEDDLIVRLIAAAQRAEERYQGQRLDVVDVVDRFDAFGAAPATPLTLSAWPIAEDAAVFVRYLDIAGEVASIADARIVLSDGRGILFPAVGGAWPTAQSPGQIVVEYEAGYADPAQVPEDVRQRILARVARWYVFREDMDKELAALNWRPVM